MFTEVFLSFLLRMRPSIYAMTWEGSRFFLKFRDFLFDVKTTDMRHWVVEPASTTGRLKKNVFGLLMTTLIAKWIYTRFILYILWGWDHQRSKMGEFKHICSTGWAIWKEIFIEEKDIYIFKRNWLVLSGTFWKRSNSGLQIANLKLLFTF